MVSSSPVERLKTTTPRRSNIKETEPLSPRLPPYFTNKDLTFEAVLFLLSVKASTIIATPPGAYPSYLISS